MSNVYVCIYKQTKQARLGGSGGMLPQEILDFFSTHKLNARIACVACPGNLAALKPPL